MNKKRYLVIMAVAVLFLASSCTGNRQPVISSLAAEAEWTAPLGSLQVTCNASDLDGDELSYNWSASGGHITGTGSEVTWTAPEEIGGYYITIVVDDGQGGNDTGSLILIAANGTMPIIETLIVTAQEPKYLKEYSWGYKAGKGKNYDIECIASNTSGELVYQWLCDGGEISGEGSTITWTAPDTSGYFTVTVIVFDVAGYMDNESIVFEVASCTSCEFG
jgi:FlaG/FlaF family flagellin (archaellin)